VQPDTISFEIYPLTPDRWNDLESLFGPRGAYGGCWCMFWRIPRTQFGRQCAHDGADNKAALHEVVISGDVPGLLAYADGQPVGWCAVAPREVFTALERSPTRKRIDDLFHTRVASVAGGTTDHSWAQWRAAQRG
jgi:hypothetical protein